MNCVMYLLLSFVSRLRAFTGKRKPDSPSSHARETEIVNHTSTNLDRLYKYFRLDS